MDFIKSNLSDNGLAIFIVPIGAIIVAILLVILITIPQVNNLIQTVKTNNENRIRMANLQTKVTELEKVDTAYDSYSKSIQTAYNAIPYDKEIPGALSQIIYLAGNANLKLKNLSVSSNVAKEGSLSSFLIRIDVEGDPKNLKEFLNILKDSPRIMKVTGIEVVSAGKENSISVSLNISIYFQELISSIADVESPIDPIKEENAKLLSILEKNATIQVGNTSNVSGPRGKIDPFE